MPGWDPKANDLFLRAREIPAPEDRQRFLDEACADKPELRASVEGLLRAGAEAGSFLERPAEELGATGVFPPAPQDERTSAPQEGPGNVIGPYKLLERIGEGGMGTVWMAEQTEPIQRRVALKVVKEGMDSRQVLARFEAERQALALMDHPNIAKVLDAGRTSSGRPYFVMELVKGKPITAYCDEKRLGVRDRLELFGAVCRAVQHAHQKGIIHRDLKPSNVLVAPYDGKPVVKVIDFGVAKATGQRLTDKTLFTGFGALVGTPEYMSPEQAEVNNQDIDTRSDIYSLGVLLYELLTGSTPLTRKRLKEAALLEVLRVIREEEPPRPSTRLSESKDALPSISAQRQTEPAKLTKLVRGELDWIVMKALEKDRNRRYETANGLVMDLERYLADEPVQACPPSAWYRFRKFARRNKALLATTAVIIVTLLAATVTVAWKWLETEQARQQEQLAKGEAEGARDEAKESEKRAKKDEDRAVQSERTARLREAEALVGQARGTRLSRRPGQRVEALAALKKAVAIGRQLGQPPAWFDELRTEAIAALCLPDFEADREWPLDLTRASAFTLADNFERYAWADMDGNVTVRRLADHAELCRLQGEGPLDWYDTLRFSPDGRFLVQHWRTATGWRARLWKLGAEPVVVISARGPTWDFSPDSRKCAFFDSEARQIRIHDPETGRELRRFPYEYEVAILRWNPRRPVLAIASPTGWRTISVETGEVVGKAAAPGCNRIDWHPEGRLLAVDTPDRKIRLWDTVTCKQVLPSFEGHKTLGIVFRFNHAGDRLLSTDWHGWWRLWDTRTGQELLTLPAGDRCLRFSADDRLVVAAWEWGSSVRLYRFLGGSECRTVVHHNLATGDITGGCAIGAEGRLLAYPTRDGIALVDMARSQEVALLPLPGNGPLQLEPRGEALWTFGRAGLLRWPLHTDSADKERRVGPPQAMFANPTYGVWWGSSPEVTLVATPCPNGALLWQRAANRTLTLAPQADVRFCAVSPDGRWVATGSWWVRDGVAVKVWDAHSGKHVATLPVASGGAVRFSPDGKWLLTSGGGARIWRTDTWQEGPALRSSPRWIFGTFSPDSELLALEDVSGAVRLVRTATGNEVARLIAPDPTPLSPQCFTPDGSRLITSANGGEALHIFDLRAIREQLQALKLDWDAPPFPPATKDQSPLQVTVDLGPFAPEVLALLAQSDLLRSKGDLVGANVALQKAHALVPDDTLVNNWLGWMLVVCPEPEKRNAKQALELAKKAVGAAPGDWRSWRTLGVAHHFAGDDREAVTALTRSLELHQSGEAFEYFPLAAAHQQLGNKEEARKWYDQGVAWMTANKTPFAAELAVLRADAEALLGIANKQSGR